MIPRVSAPSPANRNLAARLHAADQSVLGHGQVIGVDAAPGAWSLHTPPPSPLGLVQVPEVLRIVKGDIYTLAEPGAATRRQLLNRRWKPWRFKGDGPGLKVNRAIAEDQFIARFVVEASASAILILHVHRMAPMTMRRTGDTAIGFTAECGMDAIIELETENTKHDYSPRLILSDDEASIIARFAQSCPQARFNDRHVHWHFSQHGTCVIGLTFENKIELRLRVGTGGTMPESIAMGQAVRTQRKRWYSILGKVPQPCTNDPERLDTYVFAWHNLRVNRCDRGSAGLRHPFTSPARLHYGSQWWWDEAFHAIMYRHLDDMEICLSGFDNFIEAQRPDGAIPGCLRLTDRQAANLETGGMTMQPPVIGVFLQLMESENRWPQDLERIRPLYDALIRHVDWLLGPARDVDQDGLIEYHHSFDSSADQTQRWDGQKIDPGQTVGPLRPVEPVDANVWLACLCDALSALARRFGDDAIETAMQSRHDQLVDRIELLMWDQTDGFYYDMDAVTHRKIRVRTVHGLMPLLLGRFDRRRLDCLIDRHLLDEGAFWPRYPIPSTALDHPDFDPEDMWRGPTWVNMNWLVFEALLRRRRPDLARDLANRTCELLGPRRPDQANPPRSPQLFEWYHPVTGRPLGNASYAWSSLVIDMMIRCRQAGRNTASDLTA